MGHYIGKQPAYGDYTVVDDFAPTFDGTTTTFPLVANGAPITVVGNPAQYLVVLGGILQKPGVDYTVVSGSIVFNEPPLAGVSCFVIELGAQVDMGVPSAGSVGPAQLDRAYIPEQLDGSRADGTYISSSNVAPTGNTFGIRSGSDDQCIEYFGWGPSRDRYIAVGPNDSSSLHIYFGAREYSATYFRSGFPNSWAPGGTYDEYSRGVQRDAAYFGGERLDYVSQLYLGINKDPNTASNPSCIRLFKADTANNNPNMMHGELLGVRFGSGAGFVTSSYILNVCDGYSFATGQCQAKLGYSANPLGLLIAQSPLDNETYVYLNTGNGGLSSRQWYFTGYISIKNGPNSFGFVENLADLIDVGPFGQPPPINVLSAVAGTASPYTLTCSDIGKVIRYENVGGTNRELILPADPPTGVPLEQFPTGYICTVVNHSNPSATFLNSVITFLAETASVSIYGPNLTAPYTGGSSSDGIPKIFITTFNSARIYRVAANSWYVEPTDNGRTTLFQPAGIVTDYTIAPKDLNTTVFGNSSAASTAAPLKFTIPAAAGGVFSPAVGVSVGFESVGTGSFEVAPGAGVTFECLHSPIILQRYESITATYRGNNTWVITGTYRGHLRYTISPDISASATLNRSILYAITNYSSTAAGTLTIPPVDTAIFNPGVGAWAKIIQLNTGQLTLAPGAGVTLQSANGLKSRARYSVVELIYRGSNVWLVTGDTAV